MKKKTISIILTSIMALGGIAGCGKSSGKSETERVSESIGSEKEYIEETLNLANNKDQEWTYDADSDAWVLSIVSAVAYPEIEDEQGVSVCVPGAYVTGIDEDGDGTEDVIAESYTETVKGSLVIDYDAEITSTNGQVYAAATAPVILNTGAAGYSSSTNTQAATTYAKEGYINVSCGNRGKQDCVTDEDGNTIYTGDAPSCLVDQKNATRYVKYNILLGNLPGSVDYEISDGAWGCIAYSAITSLAETDMAQVFEYYLDTTYEFGSSFQAQLAEYLSAEYAEYINAQNLSVEEAKVGFDLNEDGDTNDTIALTIEYDKEKYGDTNGYGGTYLDLYLAEFTSNLQKYLDNLDYTDGWTWFDENGNALSDEEVAAMTKEQKAEAFIEGRYTKSSSGGMGVVNGDPGGAPDGNFPGGEAMNGAPNGNFPNGGAMNGTPNGNLPTGDAPIGDSDRSFDNEAVAENSAGDTMDVGTPDAGTTQAAGSSVDSNNYSTYEEMLAAYQADIAEIEAGDQYGNNIVELYNPLNYIGDEDTEDATWVRIVCGASEGDISMFSSLNLEIAMLNAGIDCEIEWQWDGGHVPSEILGDSFVLYVDQMYGEYVNGANTVSKAAAKAQTTNGDSTEVSGKNISDWVDYSDVTDVSFSLSAAAAYRSAGASKAVPGFDVIDYGQEDYVFGDSDSDARHWDRYLLEVLEKYEADLSGLFNSGN